MDGTVRLRSVIWFATAVALGVISTLIVTRAWSAGAAPGDDDATFVSIDPCRLADTRPAPARVGTAGAFGLDATQAFDAHGTNGECTLPSDAVGLSLNVTAVGATETTYLTIWGGGDRPDASSLNPAPGQPPVPNAVSTPLASDGSFRVYNFAGSVNVVIDVNGYYTKSSLEQLGNRVAALESSVATLDASMPFSTSFSDNDFIQIEEVVEMFGATGVHTELARVTMTAPVDGTITANFSGRASTQVDPPSDTQFQCHLNDVDDSGEKSLTDNFTIFFSVDSTDDEVPISVTRAFDVAAGDETTIYAFCRTTTDASPPSSVGLRDLTAVFTPDP